MSTNKRQPEKFRSKFHQKLCTSPGRVPDVILSSFNDMDYLAQEYGIVVEPPKPPELPLRERAIATNLAHLLKLIETHLNYWSKKKAPVTQDALHKAKTFVLGLLDAI